MILVRVYSRSQNFIQSFPRHIKILSELEINLCNMNHILTFQYFPWSTAGSPIVCGIVYSCLFMMCVELWTHVPWLSCTGNDSSFLLLKNVLRHGCKKDVGTPCIILMVLILAASLVNLIKELCMSFQIIPWCWITCLWSSYESLGGSIGERNLDAGDIIIALT